MAYQQPIPGSPFIGIGDTTYLKVFVGGLAWETNSETLRRYFEQFGDILEAVVITDKNTGRSKGYGFVTFYDPESARRACENPSPVIDGRRANCNLAALGRPRQSVPFGRFRPVTPLIGSMQAPRGAFVTSPVYHPQGSFGYQPGLTFPQYGYSTYGPEYFYPQGVYGPYWAQQYLQLYGAPGPNNTGAYSFGQSGHAHPGGHTHPGSHGHAILQGYGMPGQHPMHIGASNISGGTATAMPTAQAPYPAGMALPASGQGQIRVTTQSPQFTSGSDHTAG